MEKKNILKRLIHSYPDSIVVNEFDIVNPDETAYGFAEKFKDDFDDGYEKSTFGKVFDNVDELANYIMVYFPELESECQKFLFPEKN